MDFCLPMTLHKKENAGILKSIVDPFRHVRNETGATVPGRTGMSSLKRCLKNGMRKSSVKPRFILIC